jgi:hypothetical protein
LRLSNKLIYSVESAFQQLDPGRVPKALSDMRKISEEAKKRNWAALEKLVEARDDMALEVMREVFARLPYGQKFTLSDGSVAYLRKLSEPELCANPSSDFYQRPQFGFDVVIEGGKLDHVEIYAFQTGSGMAIASPRADANAKTESRTTGEGNPALTPENPDRWAASQVRRTGGHSASRSSRTKPEQGKGGPSQER